MKSLFFKLASVALTLAVFWGTLPFAGATHSSVIDPADTRGQLDISRVRVIGRDEPRWVVSTYEPWSLAAARDTGYILVLFDTFGTTRADYYALVRSTGNGLVGSLWRDHENRSDVRLRTLRISRPTAANLRIRVPLGWLNFGDRAFYNWEVRTLWTGPRCRRVCIDQAPNGAPVTEPVPGVLPPSPTPSFTLVPTETPTEPPAPAPTGTPTP